MLESQFQHNLKRELRNVFPGCVIVKTDASDIQGLPDLLILYKDKWAALEVKASAKAALRPNQRYYIDLMNEMSYSALIYPENKEEIFDALQRTFES